MIRCCNCDKQYEFQVFKGELALPVIVCPYCGYRHTVEFKAVEETSSLESIKELRLTAKKPILFKTRICDADRTALAADEADYTVNKGSKPNLIFVAQLDEEVGTYTTTYTLMWKNTTDAGAFANLAATGEINWAATTNLVQGAAVTTRLCTATGAAGSTWQNGEEVEGAATSDSIALVDECYTEVHFAINLDSALAGKTYDFQIWENTGGTALAVAAAASLTIAQEHALTANNITAGTPTLGTPTIAVIHNLTANNIASQSPVLGTPTVAVIHNLTANNLVSQSPVLGTPAIGQEHVLTANNITSGAPILGSSSVSQRAVTVAYNANFWMNF